MTRHQKTHAAIRAAFLHRGGSLEQWGRVNADPRKFNRAWRRLLGLHDGTQPPPADLRGRCPLTLERFTDDRT